MAYKPLSRHVAARARARRIREFMLAASLVATTDTGTAQGQPSSKRVKWVRRFVKRVEARRRLEGQHFDGILGRRCHHLPFGLQNVKDTTLGLLVTLVEPTMESQPGPWQLHAETGYAR